MLFNYKALENSGKRTAGSIEAVSIDVAVDSLQKRGLLIAEIEPVEKESWFSKFSIGRSVSHKDIVVLSRQMATLFGAQVSALKIFTLLSTEVDNKVLKKSLNQVVADIQAGAFARHCRNRLPRYLFSLLNKLPYRIPIVCRDVVSPMAAHQKRLYSGRNLFYV